MSRQRIKVLQYINNCYIINNTITPHNTLVTSPEFIAGTLSKTFETSTSLYVTRIQNTFLGENFHFLANRPKYRYFQRKNEKNEIGSRTGGNISTGIVHVYPYNTLFLGMKGSKPFNHIQFFFLGALCFFLIYESW